MGIQGPRVEQIEEVREFVKQKAKDFGANIEREINNSYIERNNTGHDALDDNGAYFALIHPEEDRSGVFHDFSISFFPNRENKPWLVCFGVGSSGFKNDYQLATYPGLRRLFSTLIDENGFCKSDFTDIETPLPNAFTKKEDVQHIKNTIKKYTKFFPVCQVVKDPLDTDGKKVISAFVAAYAKVRSWPSNSDHRKAVETALSPFFKSKSQDEEKDVEKLLLERKYLVIQGPPGTGKTRMAKKIAEQLKAKSFFVQFHAEITYSDFIHGLIPDTDSGVLRYRNKIGPLVESIKYAQEHPQQKVLLIIDEINRANLSNVLGPIFYLFEHRMDMFNVEIELSPGFKIKEIPENLFVIGTMNTADRSLAIVDFALRRRFAWYSLKPKAIEIEKEKSTFFADDFDRIDQIFSWHASSHELSLQPGQGYFIAKNDEEMKNRIRYELFPLIREYLQEGLLQSAKEDLNSYFLEKIRLSLFE